MEEINAHFPTTRLGMDVVKDLVTLAFCRARPQTTPPPNVYFRPSLSIHLSLSL